MRKLACCIAFVFTALIFSAPLVFAQNTANGNGKIESGKQSKEELAKAAQKPVADLISGPFSCSFCFPKASKPRHSNNRVMFSAVLVRSAFETTYRPLRYENELQINAKSY